MKVCFALLVLLKMAAPTGAPDEVSARFAAANHAYESGQFEEAARLYESILSTGKGSWQLYFNLGNAYYRQNNIGKAILNYERALRLNPDNEDVKFNLQFANLKVADRIPVPPKPAAVAWLENLVYLPSLPGLLWLVLAMYALMMVGFATNFFWPQLEKRGWLRSTNWIVRVCFIAFLSIFLYRFYVSETESFGVILATAVSVTSSPMEGAKEVFELHVGTKVQIQEISEDWAKIRLTDGKVGWLRVDTYEKI